MKSTLLLFMMAIGSLFISSTSFAQDRHGHHYDHHHYHHHHHYYHH